MFHAKTFRIERVTCKIVKFATRVRKTTISIPIPIWKKESQLLAGKIYFYKVKHISRIIWTLSISTGHFLDHSDILQTILILFRSYRYFAHHPDTLQIIHTLFGSYRYFADPLDTFWNIWTVFRPPGSSKYFSCRPLSDHPDTLQIIWTPCRPSADFLCISSDYPQDHLGVLDDLNNF